MTYNVLVGTLKLYSLAHTVTKYNIIIIIIVIIIIIIIIIIVIIIIMSTATSDASKQL